ncbi:MAG: hypothetical protein R3C53_04525 [Pirellulaceae bacterium]
MFWLSLLVLCLINGWSVTASGWLWLPPKPVGDGPEYENIGFHLARGQGFWIDTLDPVWQSAYESPQTGASHSEPDVTHSHRRSTPRDMPTTARPPLLPLAIAGVYTTLGRGPTGFATIRLLLAACTALACSLAVFMTVRILNPIESTWVGWAGGCVALLFAASNRTLRDYSTDFLTEPLALLFLQCFVLCVWMNHRSTVQESSTTAWRRNAGLVGAGVFWGLLILTRSMFVVWLPAIALLLFASDRATPYGPQGRPQVGRSWSLRRWRKAMAVVGIACLLCAPWWTRNCLVLGQFMPLGTQGPVTLIGGYSDAALKGNGDWQFAPELELRAELADVAEFKVLATDLEREVWLSREAGHRVRTWFWEHLPNLPRMFLQRIYVHWNPYTGRSLIWKFAILLGACGLIYYRQRNPTWWLATVWLLGLPLISTLVVAGFYSTGGRFLVPVYGVLFTLAGLSCVWLEPCARMLRKTSFDGIRV